MKKIKNDKFRALAFIFLILMFLFNLYIMYNQFLTKIKIDKNCSFSIDNRTYFGCECCELLYKKTQEIYLYNDFDLKDWRAINNGK